MTRKEQLAIGINWFQSKGWDVFPFQQKTWKAYLQNKNGIVNAATGSGKTYALIVPILLEFLKQHHKKDKLPTKNGLQAIWISPIKALTKEIQSAAQEAATAFGIDWNIVNEGKTSLLFTNTRSQCERWYQVLLDHQPELAGLMAMHHSAIDREQRDWVENALHEGVLRLVVCTSSLDLGVDFRPVETVIQIGSPKGVARFMQRAGRSGHQPGATSVIHFVPTHAMELIEAAALRKAVKDKNLESRLPYIRSFDVLVQYLVTLSVSGGFVADDIYKEIKKTYSYESVTPEEWNWCLAFICTGGQSLDAYDEYNGVGFYKGKYYIADQAMATRHRLSIGTIVSDTTVEVKYRNGSKIGRIEERFISALNTGDVFIFSGKVLEVVRIKEMEVRVKASKKKRAITPSWAGGRMPFSAQLSEELRHQMSLIQDQKSSSVELKKLAPLTNLQRNRSHVSSDDELLVEYFKDREGYHLVFYPFDGRHVHEGLSALIAWRLSQLQSISFSVAVNDYGFELLTDQELNVDEIINTDLFSTDYLQEHLQESANSVEMAKRKFRDIASIAGLIFKGFPGAQKRSKHLQSSSQLFFDVFQQHEPDNLLVQQAFEEVMRFQLQEHRLYQTLQRITQQKIVITRPKQPTPFSFPLITDRLREKVSSETLADRIRKMKLKMIA